VAADGQRPGQPNSLHATNVEMLSGRRKKDYEAQQAADSLVAQAEALGEAPATEPIAEAAYEPGSADEGDDDEEADPIEEALAGAVA
jgi:hypothetical protein